MRKVRVSDEIKRLLHHVGAVGGLARRDLERRKSRRERLMFNGRIADASGTLVLDRAILDISAADVDGRLDETQFSPDGGCLIDVKNHTAYQTKLVWRHGPRAGFCSNQGYPVNKTPPILERHPIEHSKHAAERIVAWKAVLQIRGTIPEIGLHPAKQRDELNLVQIAQRVARTRVRKFEKQFAKLLQSSSHPPNQEAPLESAYPLPATGEPVGTCDSPAQP